MMNEERTETIRGKGRDTVTTHGHGRHGGDEDGQRKSMFVFRWEPASKLTVASTSSRHCAISHESAYRACVQGIIDLWYAWLSSIFFILYTQFVL